MLVRLLGSIYDLQLYAKESPPDSVPSRLVWRTETSPSRQRHFQDHPNYLLLQQGLGLLLSSAIGVTVIKVRQRFRVLSFQIGALTLHETATTVVPSSLTNCDESLQITAWFWAAKGKRDHRLPEMLKERYVCSPSFLPPSLLLTWPLRHYSYECKSTTQERPYVSRPSRTQQLTNPKLVPKLASDTPNTLLNRYALEKFNECYLTIV